MNAPEQKAPEVGMWAIVELFGHQRLAGFMTEQVIAGHGFIRVDVPEIPASHGNGAIAAHSRMFGAGAIYAINPVDEKLARLAAWEIRHTPVSSYGLEAALRNLPDEHRQRLLTSHNAEDFEP